MIHGSFTFSMHLSTKPSQASGKFKDNCTGKCLLGLPCLDICSPNVYSRVSLILKQTIAERRLLKHVAEFQVKMMSS